jgi:hypothetical protein
MEEKTQKRNNMPAQTDFELAMPVFERSAVETLSKVSKCS